MVLLCCVGLVAVFVVDGVELLMVLWYCFCCVYFGFVVVIVVDGAQLLMVLW